MKKRVLSCLLLIAFAIISLVSCAPKAENFEGKTYEIKKIDIKLDKNLTETSKNSTITAIKRAYGDETAKISTVLKAREEEMLAELSNVSYKFDKDGNGVATTKDEYGNTVEQNFKYEVRSKDKYLVLWYLDENGNKIEEYGDQIFEVKGSKLIVQSSESGLVIRTVFKKAKGK